MKYAIFWPMIAQLGLTVAVAVCLYSRRTAEVLARRIQPQALKTRKELASTLEDLAASDNFQNLFEMPVLYFVVCLSLAITESVTSMQLALAWAYVACRAGHSYIHLTYNQVLHRLFVFMASNTVLLLMWVLFAYALIGTPS